LLAGELVFDGLGAGDIGIANFSMEAGQVAIEQVVPGLKADVAQKPCSGAGVASGRPQKRVSPIRSIEL
jgi:hypothetical protein